MAKGNNTGMTKAKKLLVLIVSGIIAVALSITCGVFLSTTSSDSSVGTTSGIESGEVRPVKAVTAPAANNNDANYLTNLINNGDIGYNGDYVDFIYRGNPTYYYVWIPKGKLILETWGAQGASGAKGGYAKSEITMPYAAVCSLVPGGAGSGGTGGFNGGANGNTYGGGGASHIQHGGQNTLLKDTVSGSTIVIGGGGGGYYSSVSTNSTRGQGTAGGSYGGGGGYYGGSAGYGGSSWGNSGPWGVYPTITTNNNVRSGDGLVRITLGQQYNSAPTQKTKEITGRTLGNHTVTVNTYDFAQDSDYSNYTGGSLNAVYFADATMYLDQACTQNANDYFTYSAAVGGQTLTITQFKKLPRAITGKTNPENNKIRIWMKVRDAYNGETGNATIARYFDISYNTMSASYQVSTSEKSVTSTLNGVTYTYNYSYGKATSTNEDEIPNGTLCSKTGLNTYTLCIKQPLIKGTSVAINPNDLMKVTGPSGIDTAKFKAVMEVSGNTPSIYTYEGSTGLAFGNNGAYSSFVIKAIGTSPNWQKITGKLHIVENDCSNNQINQVPPGITYAENIQNIEIIFKVDNTRPTLKDAQDNVVDIQVGQTKNITLNTYFNDVDGIVTTPTTTHKILGVEVPQYEFVQLDKYDKILTTAGKVGAANNVSYYNVAGGSITNASTTGKSTVPTYFNSNIASTSNTEDAFVQYTVTNDYTLSLTGLRPSYSQYNRPAGATAYTGGTKASPTTSGTVADPGHFYLLLHIQDVNETSDAGIWLPIAIRVGYDNNKTATGIAPVNTGSDTGSSVAGQGKLSDMPRAVGDVGDSFYFVPMGLNFGGTEYPVGKVVGADGTTVLTAGTAKDKVQALAYDGDNFSTNTGLSTWSGKLNEFLTITSIPTKVSDNTRTVDYAEITEVNVYIPTSYFGGRVAVGSPAGQNNATGVNTVNLTTGSIPGDSTSYYVTRGIKITLKSATMNRYFYVNVGVADSKGNAVSGGVNIAINVSNENPEAVTESNIAKYDSSNFSYQNDGGTLTLSYTVPMHSTFFITPYDLVKDINMEHGGAVYPTGGFTLNGLDGKYADGVFTVGGTAPGDNEIEVSAMYDTSKYAGETYTGQLVTLLNNLKNQKQTVAKVATGYAVGTAYAANNAILNDRLFFTRASDTTIDAFTFNPTTTDFVTTLSNVNDYVGVSAGNTVSIDGVAYPVDFLMFKALTRTAADAEITLNVRDRYGAISIPVKIKIAIANTAPRLKDIETVPEIAVTAKDGTNGTAIVNTSVTVTPDSVMSDLDKDTLIFVQSRGVLVARGKKIYEDLGNTLNTFNNFATLYSVYAKYLYDDDNATRLLTTYYVSVLMDSTGEFTASAIGSTKHIEEGVYVYFFVTDSRGGTTLGYMPIEVINTSPVFNSSDADGFSGEDRLWSLESARDSDITRSRYIVGSTNARDALKDKLNAVDADIKLIATDADVLQNRSGLLLSQRGSQPTSYSNYSDSTAYETTVPRISNNQAFADYPAAVFVCEDYGNGTGDLSSTVNTELLFFVNGDWYERADLIDAIGGDVAHGDVFDDQGRFIVTDWAFRVKAEEGFIGFKLRVTFSLRDVYVFGGDTAGKPTAWVSDRRTGNNENVTGYLECPDVYMYISGTGIRTKDEYNVYDNNYVVEYESENGAITPYVVKKDSSGNVSAEVYSDSDDSEEDSEGARAFEYLSTIKVPAAADGSANSGTVYVPMSYFGQKKALVSPDATTKEVKYLDTFVGYDLRDVAADGETKTNATYSIADIDGIASAISLYDGSVTWRGATGERALKNNPYVDIQSVNYMATMAANTGATYFGNRYSRDYYNTQLAVANPDCDAYADTSSFVSGTNNAKELVYLADQTTKLLEHNFGLAFTKKNIRTGTTNLVLTVNLALSQVTRNGSNVITGMSTACTDESDARSVSVSIRIENSPIDLVTDKDESSLEFDNTYHVDITMSTSASKAFTLVRNGSDSYDTRRYEPIYYTDSDYNDQSSRDNAFFSLESISGLSKTSNARPASVESGVFANTSRATVGGVSRAQQSMKSYYGVTDLADVNKDAAYSANAGRYRYNSYFNITTSDSGKAINIRASRKTYINESALKKIVEDEFADDPLFSGFSWNSNLTYGGLSYKRLTAIYASRGMRVQFGSDSDTVSNESTVAVPNGQTLKAYYVLKTLIFDTCGAGWSDASYVSLEFRINIVNSTPTLNTDNLEYNATRNRWEKRTKLAVDSTMYLELEKYINDPDIYTVNSQLATVNQFNASAQGVDRETGDYLESLFKYNYTSAGKTQGALLSGSAKLSLSDSDEADVIMYMEVESATVSTSTVPAANRLWFRVNRRTSDDQGNILNVFEFTMTFRDNHYTGSPSSETEEVTFIIEVENQAPVINTKTTRITMHTGDSFVLLTSYYDVFIGGEDYLTTNKTYPDGNVNKLPIEGSLAYQKSKTFTTYFNNRTANGAMWKYQDITTANEAGRFKTDTSASTTRQMLGYLGVADDDAPWRMRFDANSYDDYRFITVTPQNVTLPELSEGTPEEQLPMALLITASSACTLRPVTFDISDGEGGTVSFTIEFTIISAPPVAYNPNGGDRVKLALSHLEGVPNPDYDPDDEASDEAEYLNNASYNTFIIPSGGSDGVRVNLNGLGQKRAYKEIEVVLNNIAYDPDDANAKLTLHSNGYFKVNGQDLVADEYGHYVVPDVTNYFYITKTDNAKFKIHATGYNPASAFETLTFRVGDPGNDVYANSLEITIRIYTIYSDMENPTVGGMSQGAYEDSKDGYLAGSNVVHVKPYDEYIGIGEYSGAEYVQSWGKPTVYNYIHFSGGDLENPDGTPTSPIVDRDASAAGALSYAVRVYAFMENDQALSAARIGELLRRSGNAFAIDPASSSRLGSYLIGGIDNGHAINATGTKALETVSKYFGFTIAGDGTSISFVPKTATLGKKLMIYIEVQKLIEDRAATRTDDAVSAGTLFSLVVDDSAPRDIKLENKDYSREFVGYKGSTVTYRLHGGAPGESLFDDSDVDDVLTMEIPSNANDSWYRDNVLSRAIAEDPLLDWASNGADQKNRAITVTSEGEFVTITINRRMDKKLADGSYANAVTFPLVITCNDKGGKTNSATIMITVRNTPLTGKSMYSYYDEQTGVRYEFEKDNTSAHDNEYILRASVLKGRDLTVRLSDFLDDADYKLDGNTDSFRFIGGSSEHQTSFEYLRNEPIKAIYYTDIEAGRSDDLATVTPIYTGDTELSYTGFTINAESSVRNSTGSLRIHIIDRAGDESADEGIYVTLRITVINTPPEVIEGMDGYTVDILGSDSLTNDLVLNIKDFVTDRNESDVADMENASIEQKGTKTWLRIYMIRYSNYTEINASDKATLPDGDGYADDSSLLFKVSDSEQDTGNQWNQAFSIRPNVGFYGSGEFIVTIADGDMNDENYVDTEFVDFRVKVNVIYNPADISGMELAPMARGKTRTVTISDLIKDMNNAFSSLSGQNNVAGRANGTFNPASWYTLISIIPTNEAKEYVEATKVADGEWSLHALAVTAPSTKRINVVYALKSDIENSEDGEYPTYPWHFDLRINENMRPVLVYNNMTFRRYAEEGEIDPMFKLDNSNAVYLFPGQLFNDPEDDVMTIVSVKSNKESLVSVWISDEKDRIVIKFNASGTAELTITVADESGVNYTYENITVTNTDLPEPDLWMRFMASLEANKVMWAIIFAAIVLAIIILIIIIAVIKKRKHAREELEALLVSEMEIEEQMLRLAGGPAPTGYQSYGYLQAPGQPPVDPGMMLGAGMTAPDAQQLELAPPPPQQTDGAGQQFASPNTQGFDDVDNF